MVNSSQISKLNPKLVGQLVRSEIGKVGILILVFLILPDFSNAQVLQPDRFELALSKDERHFEIAPAEDRGLFLHRRLLSVPEDRIEIVKLDTSFQVNWHGYLPIDRKHMLMGKRAERDYLYLLLRHREYTRKDFELFAVHQKDGSYTKYTIKNFIPFAPSDFQITENGAVVGGYFNTTPVVIYFSFLSQRTKVLPGLFNEMGELNQIKTYEDGSFDLLISARNFKGQKTIWIKSYDPEGNLLRNLALEAEDNKHLIFARSIKTSSNLHLVAGVYGGRNSEYSKGLFIASIDPTGLQHIKYYNYADLENFFKYMKAKREQRVKERIERRKIRGKRTRFNYRFLVHELVRYNNQFVLLGEAFYPRYVTVDRSYYSGFFNPYLFTQPSLIRDGRIFDGYRYTHAVVMGFDKNGKLLWDNSFEINDVKTFTLEQFVKLEIQHDKIALLYLYENQLRSKIIQNSNVVEGKTFEPIRTKFENEIAKMESSSASKLDYWYDDFFYASGVQEITSSPVGKRRVFFINKISYR